MSTSKVARAGRPRDAKVHRRILVAALEEYAESGWPGFSIEGVARRAGVGKSTIYLRWPDKEAMLIEGVQEMSRGIERVDTGTFVRDLRGISVNLMRHYLDPLGWATLRMMVESARSPESAVRFQDVVIAPHLSAAHEIVERAIQRGEVRADLPARSLIELLYGGVTMYALTHPLGDAEVSDEQLAAMIDGVAELLTGALAPYLMD